MNAADKRDHVHHFERVNDAICVSQIFALCILIVVGGIFNFWDSKYFEMGTPVSVHQTVIKKKWHFWLLIALFVFSQMVAALSTKVIGHYRAVTFDHAKVKSSRDSFAFVACLLSVDHAISWLRYSALIIFLYSQISFAFAFAVPDIILSMIRGQRALVKRHHRRHAGADGKAEAIDEEDKSIWYKIPASAIIVLQLIEIAAFLLVFWKVGFFKSPFFHFGPKVELFGTEITTVWAYTLLIFFAFGQQMLGTLTGAVVAPWFQSHVYNNSKADMPKTDSSIYTIFAFRKFVMIVRTLLVANFATTQLMFLISMFLGDLTMTFIIVWATWARMIDGNPHDFIARTLPSVGMITALGVVEIFILIIVALSMKIWTVPYFEWPPPLEVFDVILDTLGQVIVIMIFAVIDKVADTVTSEILTPYISNVIYGNDPHDRVYSEDDDRRIMFINLITGWIRRVVGYNFLFSNVSFIVIGACVEIPLSCLILSNYLRHKRRVYNQWNVDNYQRLTEYEHKDTTTEQVAATATAASYSDDGDVLIAVTSCKNGHSNSNKGKVKGKTAKSNNVVVFSNM
jgi:hypothetical protein